LNKSGILWLKIRKGVDRVLLVDILALGVALPAVLAPRPEFAPLLLAIPLAWFTATKWRRHALEITPFNPTMLLLVIMALISLYATYSIEQSFPKLAGLTFGLGIFFAIAGNIHTRRSFYGLMTVFLLAGLSMAVLGALGSRWLQKVPTLITITESLPSFSFGLHGASEGFHPNEVAGVLLWVAPPALSACGVILCLRKALAKNIGKARSATLLSCATITALATCGVLLLTQSRSGWIGAFAALLWIMAVLLNQCLSFERKWRILFWISFAILLIGAGIALAPCLLEESLDPGFDDVAGSVLSVGSLKSRVEIWSRAIYGVEDFPLTGVGMNTFRQAVHILYPLFTLPPDKDFAHAHNHLLQVALDLGLPGLIAYLSLWFTAAVMLHRIWSRSVGWEDHLWVLGLGGGLLGHFIYGLSDAIALGAKPGFIWWYLLALIAGLYKIVEKEAKGTHWSLTMSH
jgi:putative inorganic carbon (HCO3(-)) transporter